MKKIRAITQCKGEGQGSCRRCLQIYGWSTEWMHFLYRVEGIEGLYCSKHAEQVAKGIKPTYKRGTRIESLDELLECDLIWIQYDYRNYKIYAKGWFMSWSVVSTYTLLRKGNIYKVEKIQEDN